jgi:PKD repeat protein
MFFNNLSYNSTGPWFWSFGDGTSSTMFSPTHTYAAPGLYNVSLHIGDSSTGCWDYVVKLIHVGDSIPPACQAAFYYYHDSTNANNVYHFVNQSNPQDAAWYWNFGDPASGANNVSHLKNAEHVFSQPGDYNVCLTMTTTNPQCTSTVCHIVHVGPPPPPPCENWITYMKNWLHVEYEGHILGNPPATYNWTFGDGHSASGQNVVHDYAAPGLYTVTLHTVTSDSNHCEWNRSIQIHVGDSTNIRQVYGQVFAGNFPMAMGMVMIFGLDTVPGTLPFFASDIVDSMGVYMFPYVPEGDFIVWALPFDSTGGYLPTYYGNVLWWNQATVIHLGQPVNPYNINLIQATSMPSGSGGINGQVNAGGLKSSQVSNIAMILENSYQQQIGFRKVRASGAFDFSQMGFGTYYLRPELAGTTAQTVKVEISSSKPVASVVMTLNGNSIMGIDENPIVDEFLMYPMPVKDVLNLNLTLTTSTTVRSEILNFTGQSVYDASFSLSKGGNTLKLDAGLLAPGVYILKMTSPDGIRIVRKFVK